MARFQGCCQSEIIVFFLMPFITINKMNCQTNITWKRRERSSRHFPIMWKLMVKRLKSHIMALSFSLRCICSLWNFNSFIYWSVNNYFRVHIACDEKWARAVRRRWMNCSQMNQSSFGCLRVPSNYIADTHSVFPLYLRGNAKSEFLGDCLMQIQSGMRERDIEFVAT